MREELVWKEKSFKAGTLPQIIDLSLVSEAHSHSDNKKTFFWKEVNAWVLSAYKAEEGTPAELEQNNERNIFQVTS